MDMTTVCYTGLVMVIALPLLAILTRVITASSEDTESW